MSDWWQADPVASAPERPKITVTPTQRAFLNSMSAGEAPDYNTMYGGGRFEELNDHPRQNIPIQSGPNAGKTSSAAGRYQFLQGTWDEAKNALGLPDFSPESQDAAAVWLAQRDYKARTGRDLWNDIEGAKDNPAKLNFISGALGKTWTSLPGGAEPNNATAGFGQRMASEISAQARNPQAQGNWWANDPVAGQPTGQPEMQGPPQRQVGMGEAIGRGVQQGASFNFSDEIAGLKAASGIPETARNVASAIPIANLIAPTVGAARMGYEALSGGNQATDEYNRVVEAERAGNKLAQEQRPYSYIGGNIAGAVAMPIGGMANAATLPARIGRGAAVGAIAGGVAGAGEGETAGQRLTGAASGAVLGSAVGAAAPAAVAGAEAIGRGIGAAVSPVTNRIAGAINPERQAAKTAVEYLGKGAPELTQAEYAAAQAAGLPVANIDRGGEAGRALARWAGNVSPEARETIQKFADARFEGQGERAIQFLQNIAGTSGDTTILRDALKGLARIENRPAYERAFRNPNAQAMWDEGFEQISQAPVVQDAIRAASVTGANRATLDGFQRARSPFVIDKQTGQLTLRIDENGNRMLPSLQFWNEVKINLDKVNSREAQMLNGALKSHLDELVPDYKKARAGAASFFGAEDALDAGQKFVHQNMAIGEASKALSKMSPAERDMFKIGFVSKLIDDVGNTRDRINVVGRINNSPNAKTKLQMVLGENGYRQFDALMSVEQSVDKLRGALGNSSTVRQWIELGLAGSVGGTGFVMSDPTSMGVAAAIAGRRYVDQRLAKEIARMLTSGDPDVLAKGVKAVSGNKNLLRAFRDFDARLSSVGGQQAPSVVPVPGWARAEGDNPDVNGPRR